MKLHDLLIFNSTSSWPVHRAGVILLTRCLCHRDIRPHADSTRQSEEKCDKHTQRDVSRLLFLQITRKETISNIINATGLFFMCTIISSGENVTTI